MNSSTFTPGNTPSPVSREIFLANEGVYAQPGNTAPGFVNLGGSPFAIGEAGALTALDPSAIPSDATFVRLSGRLDVRLDS